MFKEGSSRDGEARAHDEILVKKYGLRMSVLGKVLRADAFAVVVTWTPWPPPPPVPEVS